MRKLVITALLLFSMSASATVFVGSTICSSCGSNQGSYVAHGKLYLETMFCNNNVQTCNGITHMSYVSVHVTGVVTSLDISYQFTESIQPDGTRFGHFGWMGIVSCTGHGQTVPDRN